MDIRGACIFRAGCAKVAQRFNARSADLTHAGQYHRSERGERGVYYAYGCPRRGRSEPHPQGCEASCRAGRYGRMMDKVINLRLLAHPMNWLIVWTVLAFAGFAWVHFHEISQTPPTA